MRKEKRSSLTYLVTNGKVSKEETLCSHKCHTGAYADAQK